LLLQLSPFTVASDLTQMELSVGVGVGVTFPSKCWGVSVCVWGEQDGRPL